MTQPATFCGIRSTSSRHVVRTTTTTCRLPSPLIIHHRNSFIVELFVIKIIMKNSVILAAGALLGSATAGVHKAKLQKIPLSQQLVSTLATISYRANIANPSGRNMPTSTSTFRHLARSIRTTWAHRQRLHSARRQSTRRRRAAQSRSRTSSMHSVSLS